MPVQKTLDQRRKQYGKYSDQLAAKVAVIEALNELHCQAHGTGMSIRHTAVITDIVTKLTRVAVDINHADSWHDIAGFATLIEDIVLNQVIVEADDDAYSARTTEG